MSEERTIHVRATRNALRLALEKIPSIAGASEAVLTRMGLTLLGRIKRAFITKARGGTDEAGDRWAPLSPKTIAYGRAKRTRGESKRDTRPSQALTAKQQKRWWDLYRQGLAIFKGNKGSAAKRAWSILKREGATTLVNKYGNRRVEILRDTGLLLNSLSPGVASSEAIFRIEHGAVVVGTNRKGASAHHHGNPARNLPQRRLWAEPNKWPSTWWKDILAEVKQAILEIATQTIRSTT